MPLRRSRSILFVGWFLLCWMGIGAPAQAALESSGQVWQVGERRWDAAEEEIFAIWVEANVTADFLLRHGIAVDCADVPYAIRWIYARIARLPAAATMNGGRLTGHWSTAWANLPTHPDWWRDQRFRAALSHVLGATTTATLPADTYPIRIGRDSVLPGAMFFVSESHAGLVGRIVLDGSEINPVQTWEATLPRKLRKLRERNFFSTPPNKDERAGLVRFRWPVLEHGRWTYLPVEEHPYYSEEQYDPDFCRHDEEFDDAVARRLEPAPIAPRERAEKLIAAIKRRTAERIPIVLEGYNRCKSGGCREGTYLWELYSTLSRDAKLGLLIEHLEKVIKINRLDREGLKQQMEKISITISGEQGTSLAQVMEDHDWLSHDPADSIEARWGLRKCDMIRARMENYLRALDFVEGKYRATAPRFADYGRNFHLENLRLLREEGNRAGCGKSPPLPDN